MRVSSGFGNLRAPRYVTAMRCFGGGSRRTGEVTLLFDSSGLGLQKTLQIVSKVDPRELVIQPSMICRRKSFRIVKAACGEVNLGGVRRILVGNWCSA